MPQLASVILPCFNDGQYIKAIIDEISQSKLVGEIIVVNDGSDAQTINILNSILNIRLINHPRNLGKSQAMKTGLLSAKYPIILFVDSDLIGFNKHHVRQLLSPVINNNYDMVIGEVDGLLFIFKWTGYSVAYAGVRAIKKDILLKNINIFNSTGYIKGFIVEANMNKVFFNKYKIARTLLKNITQPYKISRRGLKGWINDLKIMSHIQTTLGWPEHLRQLAFSKKLPRL